MDRWRVEVERKYDLKKQKKRRRLKLTANDKGSKKCNKNAEKEDIFCLNSLIPIRFTFFLKAAPEIENAEGEK